ncbi:MAG: DUF1836 domain-containing protein [Oscillospiraceae bacterium]|nr:DUF1836 domain-containing protein [Oscillospiraceae bacterium]
MTRTLPGTTIQADLSRSDGVEAVLGPMFLTGGLTLSQVTTLTGLEPYVIQNWVRRGFLSPPQQRRYSRRQLCRILTVNMLKDVLQLEKICSLLSYVNGNLEDESDDLVDDSYLYEKAVWLIARSEDSQVTGIQLKEALKDYSGTPEARERVERVLVAICKGYLSARLKAETEELISGFC